VFLFWLFPCCCFGFMSKAATTKKTSIYISWRVPCPFTRLKDSGPCIVGLREIDAERAQPWRDLRSTDTEWGTPIRDILGGTDTTLLDRSHNRTLNSFGGGPSLWSSFKKKNKEGSCSFLFHRSTCSAFLYQFIQKRSNLERKIFLRESYTFSSSS
jgi:hypothetical protein